ncbi:MAG: right-handed parallel beta-helix repeat-containing protein, partial [Candidatus Omnitrophota bacterium]
MLASAAGFAEPGNLDDGKALFLGEADMVGAHTEFDAALTANPTGQPENFWHAATVISQNANLKAKLRELEIFGPTGTQWENKPIIFDDEGEPNFNTVTPVDTIIMDDGSAGFEGTAWGTYSEPTDLETAYGTSCRYHEAGTGANVARWTPSITTAGYYDVYAWVARADTNATDAKYRISGLDGFYILVDQRNHEGWQYLGAYYFPTGATTSVTLSDNTSTGRVVADAMKFLYGGIVIDDSDAIGFATTESGWTAETEYGNSVKQNYHKHAAGSSATATWTFDVPDFSKEYLVYFSAPKAAESEYSGYQYKVMSSGAELKTRDIKEYNNYGQWYCLGVFQFTSLTGNTITLETDGSQDIAADAVRIVPCRPYPDMTEGQGLMAGTVTQINEALLNLSIITNGFTDQITSAHLPDLKAGEVIDLDYGDAKAIEAMLYFMKFNIKLNESSDGDNANLQPLFFGEGNLGIAQFMLNDYPDMFKLRTDLTDEQMRALLGEAKTALISGIDSYNAASTFIRARPNDDKEHFIMFYEPGVPQDERDDILSKESEVRNMLDQVRTNLADAGHPLITIPAYFEDGDGNEIGSGLAVQVDMNELLTNPRDIRFYMNALLANEIINDDLDPGIATLGGILPDMTPKDWNYLLGYGPNVEEKACVLWNNDVPSVRMKWDPSEDPNSANIEKYEIYRSTTIDVDKNSTNVAEITDPEANYFVDDTIDNSSDAYYYRLYTYYDFGDDDTAETYSPILSALVRIYVNAAATGEEDGTKAHPYKDLGDAISHNATGGTKICVSKGTYSGSSDNIHFEDGMILEGGYDSANNWSRDAAANETIIDGTGRGGWALLGLWNRSGITIDGFTVTGAFMQEDARAIEMNYSSLIVIKNCKIINNRRAIGMWNNSSATITNCQISQSLGQYDSVQVEDSSLNISDSSIYANGPAGNLWISAIGISRNSSFNADNITVTQNNGRGIGVWSFSTFDIRNSRITENAGLGFESNNSYGAFFNNLVANNGQTGVSFGGLDLEGQILVENNTITGNGESGGMVCNRVPSTSEADDQQNAGYFTYAGNWNEQINAQANWGRYKLHEAGNGSDFVKWIPKIVASGDYNVYATWTGGAAHSGSAGYEIHHDGGVTTVYVNQTGGTTGWLGQLLGQYHFTAGQDHHIILREHASGQVVADSIKMQYVLAGPETFTPAIRNNIIAENNGNTDGGKRGICAYGGANPVVSYNNVWGNANGDYDGPYTDGGGNISTDPLFVTGPDGDYYLSQTAAGQEADSPCVNAGSREVEADDGTTRTDQKPDSGILDMGYHYLITDQQAHKDEVILDYGEFGIHVWDSNGTPQWTQLHTLSPELMVTGDFDGDNQD